MNHHRELFSLLPVDTFGCFCNFNWRQYMHTHELLDAIIESISLSLYLILSLVHFLTMCALHQTIGFVQYSNEVESGTRIYLPKYWLLIQIWRNTLNERNYGISNLHFTYLLSAYGLPLYITSTHDFKFNFKSEAYPYRNEFQIQSIVRLRQMMMWMILM